MRSTLSLAALVAMAASALAQKADFDPIYKPARDEAVPAGSTYKIVWDAPAKYAGADDTITINLIGGPFQNALEPAMAGPIATGVLNSQKEFSWNVGPELGDKAIYGLVFKLEKDAEVFQYSNPFKIVGGAKKSDSSVPPHGVKTIVLSSSKLPAPTTSLEAAYEPTTVAVPTHAKVNCGGFNSTAIIAKPTNLPAVSSNAAPGYAAPGNAAPGNASVVVNPAKGSGIPAPVSASGAAPALGAGMLGLGGLVAAALAL